MKILRALFISSILSVSAFAEDFPVFDDGGYNPENDNIGRSEEISKIDILEKEVQNLTGRIEVLEHSLQELQKSSGAKSMEAPGIGKAIITTEIIKPADPIKVDPKDEKREYDMALSTLKDGKHDEAEKLFGSFMQNYPKSTHLSNAYFWYADTFYRRGDFDKAAIHFLKGYQKFPASSKAPDALLKLALSLGEMKKNTEACSILKKLDTEFKKRSQSSIKRAYDAKIKYGCK